MNSKLADRIPCLTHYGRLGNRRGLIIVVCALALTLPTQGCGRSSSPDAAPAARYRASGSAYVPSQVQGGSVLELPHGGLLGLGEGGNVYWLDRSLRPKVVFWKRPACASIFPGNIAAGTSGHVYILGSATGNCVPTTPNAAQRSFQGGKDSFVVVLDRDGRILYGTYLGGSKLDDGNVIATDRVGDAFVEGTTSSPNFPFRPAVKRTASSFHPRVFVARINLGSGIVYARPVDAEVVAGDNFGDAYVAGTSQCGQLQTTRDALQPRCSRYLKGLPLGVGYLARLTPGGSVAYQTYLAGGQYNTGADASVQTDVCCVAVSGDRVVVAGTTDSPGFPVRHAFQRHFGGNGGTAIASSPGGDGFVASISGSGQTIFSTYLGGKSNEEITSLGIDRAGHIFVGGGTDSRNFPTMRPIQHRLKGPTGWEALCGGTDSTDYCKTTDGFVTELSRTGRVLFSSYLGGRGTDEVVGINGGADRAYVTSLTNSKNFPLVPPKRTNPASGHVLTVIRSRKHA